MYTPGTWVSSGCDVKTADGERIAVASTEGNAALIRTAADLYEFVQTLAKDGHIFDRNLAVAERLLARASGIGS